MAKTPPLVIPVIVDASGVNSGLSNINRRLSGARGNAGSDNGNFGSGGALALGAAAGFAARGGSRLYASRSAEFGMSYANNARLAKRVGTEALRDFNKSTPLGWLLQQRADASAAKARGISQEVGELNRANANILNRATQAARGGRVVDPAFGADVYEANRLRAERLERRVGALRRRTRMFAGAATKASTAISVAGRAIGYGAGAAAGALGSVGLALGAGALGYGAFRYGRNLAESDFPELVGSPDYGKLRKAQLRDFARYRGRGTLAQNFSLGAESGWGISEGGGVANISDALSFGLEQTARGLGRMASRPISGTIENFIRLVAWAVEPDEKVNEKLYRQLGME